MYRSSIIHIIFWEVVCKDSDKRRNFSLLAGFLEAQLLLSLLVEVYEGCQGYRDYSFFFIRDFLVVWILTFLQWYI